ncbi:MAG: molybdenum ABC transporter ATP-binding protein [Acidobacteria bacterium]|nr:MAG: molybdenum ABC transporter ATP-binding protein [Acidobacteriota bacterium]
MSKSIAIPSTNQLHQSAPALAARFRKHHTEGDFTLDVDLSTPAGFTILFGSSGAGKTTLLDCIAGLASPDAGTIQVGSQLFFDAQTRFNLPVAKRNVGYVFQDLALFPHLTVAGNIAYGLDRFPASDRQRRIAAILEAFHIRELRNRRPREISGGERQRVALARSLVTDPCILLLDEPLAALDAPTKSRILDDLRAWNDAHRIPILYVTHGREEVFALGERVVVLDRGHVLAQGTPHEVMGAPRQETVAQLAGFENIFDATVIAAHEDRGTMTCKLAGGKVELETPLVRANPGSALRIGIRAGDILLATRQPEGLSARNVLPGEVTSIVRHDVIIAARVDVGVEMEVHLTLAARDALQLAPAREVWLIVKTHSCHLLST